MTSRIPDFFEDRTESWRFDDVLAFIDTHFNVSKGFAFRVGNRFNTPDENQRAGAVFAYAQQMDYTFNQVKTLFSEHDHFAIAMPETREGRNILEFNRLFVDLLHKGHDADIKINDFPELFDIPRDVLVVMDKRYYHNLNNFEDWDGHYKAVWALLDKDKVLIKKAITLIKKYHDQERTLFKGIYNRHPLRVARILLEEFGVNDTNTVLIALCHDLGEWSDYDINDLKKEFNSSVYKGVKILTRDRSQNWETFIKKIVETNNKDLIKIKIADKLDNNRGVVFSDNKEEQLKAKEKTRSIMKPIIDKYYPEYWPKFEEIIEKVDSK